MHFGVLMLGNSDLVTLAGFFPGYFASYWRGFEDNENENCYLLYAGEGRAEGTKT